MVPSSLLTSISPPASSLLLSIAASISHHVPLFSNPLSAAPAVQSGLHTFARRKESEPHDVKFIVFATLIPVLVILSGVFAGLTLGYMSLDETQLQVLSISGTPQQRKYANKIMPIRKNGHLLLVTLLLANMIVNETLPVISDPILGGGVQSVVVSTILIVIFAEIIPQSVCTRHGLLVGAKMAPFVRVLLYTLGIVAWPVAKLLEFILGPHHGIIYRRAELKELIAMHSSMGIHGGDLRSDTVTIIGATLDLQEKTAKQAMTKIDNVFMLSIDAKLDYKTLKQVCATGHSRVPVYEEVEMPDNEGQLVKVKKIVGVLLVKQCVLLDPKDAVPVRSVPLNKVPSVAQNEPLLGILDKFQEGRSHMAIVSRFSVEKAASVKKAVKKGLTQRLKDRVGISDSSSSDTDGEEDDSGDTASASRGSSDHDVTLKSDTLWERNFTPPKSGSQSNSGESPKEERGHFSFRKKRKNGRKKRRSRPADLEMGVVNTTETQETKDGNKEEVAKAAELQKAKKDSFVQLPKFKPGLEQSMPADAVLSREGAGLFLQGYDPFISPLGIITLEDVLEELIGEEIYDEFDPEGAGHGEPSGYIPPQSNSLSAIHTLPRKGSAPQLSSSTSDTLTSNMHGKPVNGPPPVPAPSATQGIIRPIAIPALKGLSFLTTRSRSAPPTPRPQDVKDTSKGGDASGSTTGGIVEKGTDSDDRTVDAVYAAQGQGLAPPSIIVDGPAGVQAGLAVEESLRAAVRVQQQQSMSRSASPAPSIEARIYDRSRARRVSQTQVGAGAVIGVGGSSTGGLSVGGSALRVATPSSKGGRFKSSPLGAVGGVGVSGVDGASGGGSGRGMEAVDEDEGKDVTEEGRRIPDGMEKVGPDKADEEEQGYTV